MGDYYGYVILAIFAVIFIGISIFVSKKFPIEGVDDFVAAGRGIPSSLVAASVMVSWVWTTTIMGSAEAGMSFGISGGLNYAWGNSIPFFVLIHQTFKQIANDLNLWQAHGFSGIQRRRLIFNVAHQLLLLCQYCAARNFCSIRKRNAADQQRTTRD